MDVTLYPPPPQPLAASEHTRLGQLSYPEPPFGSNKLEGEGMFLSMQEVGVDYVSSNQFRVPQPLSKATPPNPAPQHWRRDDTQRLAWSYQMGDEDYNFAPITPPHLPDHMLPPHLPQDSPTGPYGSLDGPAHSAPHHPYQLQGMNVPRMPRSQDGATMLNQDGGTFSPDGAAMTSTLSVMQQMVNSDSRFTSSQQPIQAALGPRSQSGAGQLATINQSQLTHNSPSPPGSTSATPSPSSSPHQDDHDDNLRVANSFYHHGEKRPAAFDMSKKAKTPKKKKRKDPNEPVKPVSAYALFFRDTQANIKAQNPNATFGEVSKIVASMWDGLGEEQKQEYKKRTETAKKEYLKQLAAYRASLVSQSYNDPCEMKPASSSSSIYTSKSPVYAGQHQHPNMYMPYPHHSTHLPQMHTLSTRGSVLRPTLSLGGSTPPHQVSPPLHSQTHLGGMQHQHQQHSMAMTHPPAITQAYSLQSEYQPMMNRGAMMSSPVDYQQLGPHHHPSLDWSAHYHGNGTPQPDKTLYLT
ncbi:thymocyte selection-associated high mobility group box protein TOX-like isoform X1 [Entelurus aequoreus]|uniref:thymocyte selection-associated high mobility group box protein TOX-like isoform X1 n=2 Tax=Entelurus aequoreus TaxID=161455 RepID=UPI002B1DA9F6|nr:thymocyte selection-associated high mobility group box protein TOX-like isoform X1 [Entelurus aequoreus]